jgi:hypothetical protein
MRMTVDKAGDRAKTRAVELLDVAVDRGKLAHRSDGGHALALAEDEGVFDHLEVPQRPSA